MTHDSQNAGGDEIRRLMQEEVVARIPLLLKYTSSAGLRLQVPDTDVQIIAGPQAWICSQVIEGGFGASAGLTPEYKAAQEVKNVAASTMLREVADQADYKQYTDVMIVGRGILRRADADQTDAEGVQNNKVTSIEELPTYISNGRPVNFRIGTYYAADDVKNLIATQVQAAAPATFDDYPDYNEQAMGCGLEDRGITDRYDAMRYGWDEALDCMAKRLNHFFADFSHPAAAVEPVAIQTGLNVSPEAIEAIQDAIKETEYKYFGVYEMSEDQQAAVDVLVKCAQHVLELLAAAPSPAADLPSQAEPKPLKHGDIPSIEITLRQAKELIDCFGGYDAEISIIQRPAAWAEMPNGLYAYFSEYPEEGSMYLGPTEVDDELAINGESVAAPSSLPLAVDARDQALRTIAEFPVTDAGNMDAWNMRTIAIEAVKGQRPASQEGVVDA